MKPPIEFQSRSIVFLSANETPWGGSEELWFEAALALAGEGWRVRVMKPRLPTDCDRVDRLRDADCKVADLARPFGLPLWLFARLSSLSRIAAIFLMIGHAAVRLLANRPQLVVLCQGGNWDGVHLGWVISRLRLPYVIVSQKAAEIYWPPDGLRRHVQKLYRRAAHAFFVSNHNLALTEMQIGERFRSASVIRNPFLVPFEKPLPWPDGNGAVNIACVGRLYTMEKGQDLLLQLLARPTWRNRPVEVTFYGEGVNREGLEGMAALLGLDNVRFAGQVDDVAAIWRENSLLVLPSRSEGLPLVIVEAMLAGRVVIASDAGGNGEIFDDNVTGFLARGWTADALDEAMERAWARRGQWPSIGEKAAEAIRRAVPSDPGAELARQLIAIASSADGAEIAEAVEPQPANAFEAFEESEAA